MMSRRLCSSKRIAIKNLARPPCEVITLINPPIGSIKIEPNYFKNDRECIQRLGYTDVIYQMH